MAYTYHDFEESTGATRISRLKQHITEVRLQMGPDVASDGKSRSTGQLASYLAGLVSRLTELEQGAGSATAGGISRARIMRRGFR